MPPILNDSLSILKTAPLIFTGFRLCNRHPEVISRAWQPPAFTAAAGVVSVLICGLIPAIATTRTSPLDAMRAQATPSGRLKTPARKIFVVAQLAVSMALLMATGLLVRTLIHLENVNMGFNNHQNAAIMGIAVPRRGPQRQAEFDALVNRMRALPGVKDASVARVVPFP